VDRSTWLSERRAAVAAAYDAEAAIYDEHEYPSETQREWVRRFVSLLATPARVLDAACGTGKYFPILAAAGAHVVGVDGSAGMLEQARARGVAESVERVALQDLAFDHEFDGVLIVDAMEHVPPEDWPTVVTNLHRAIRSGGLVYISLEEIDRAEIDRAYERRGPAPSILGEVVEGDTAGYHYYPSRGRALGWISAAGFTVVVEEASREQTWGYRHLLLRATAE